MSACMIEHRWGNRTRVDIPVKLIGSSRSFAAGQLKDISTSGAYIETRFTQPLLESVTLILLGARNGQWHPRAVRGYIVRQCEGAIGLGWWDMAPEPVEQLLALRAAMNPRGDMPSPHAW